MRSLFICITCLLSLFQSVTISPNTFLLVRFKCRSTKYIVHLLFFLSSLSLSFGSNLIFYTVALPNVIQSILQQISKFCFLAPIKSIINVLFFTLRIFKDGFFIVIMLLSSTYMVILLFRHQRHSQNLHSTSFSLRISPEKGPPRLTCYSWLSLWLCTGWISLYHRPLSCTSKCLWKMPMPLSVLQC